MNYLRPAFVLLVLLTFLTGVAYPLAMTGIAQLIFPYQANGSLIEQDGKIIGAQRIGQNFTSDKYFHGRPSATTPPYNAASSSGSNLGPTSKTLIEQIKARADELHAGGTRPIPVDMVTSSASGLDPHITPAAAAFQVPRVAMARNLPELKVAEMVTKYTDPPLWGFLGEPRVNVLLLNQELDKMQTTK